MQAVGFAVNNDARRLKSDKVSCYLQLRYVDTDYVTTAVPLILESGTSPDVYPADYYGCPYPPGNAGEPCVAPPAM